MRYFNLDTYCYTYDGNGNVSELMKKSDGTASAHYEYDPYGNSIYNGPSSSTMKDANSYRFSTKFRDGTSQLYYYGYRFYNTVFGRWVSRDEIGKESGPNPYAFRHSASAVGE